MLTSGGKESEHPHSSVGMRGKGEILFLFGVSIHTGEPKMDGKKLE